jgi:L,D-transpeptidase YbiS
MNEEAPNIAAQPSSLPEVSPTVEKTPEVDQLATAALPATAQPLPPVQSAAGQALLVGIGLGLFFALLALWFAPVWREWMFAILPESKFALQLRTTDLKQLRKEAQRLEKRVTSLQKKYAAITPRLPYLIVDTSENRIQVMKAGELLHEGVCSTGSYVLLRSAVQQRQWMFVTPRGMFQIRGKRINPVWAKPDWAFIEEGLPVPPLGSPERFEAGVLGEYALELGDGYLIHGTLYKRMLGMPVTHGCVRLGDEDLRLVYKNLQIGSKVFIY